MAMDNTQQTETTDTDVTATGGAAVTGAEQEDALAQRIAADQDAVQAMQREMDKLTAAITQARKGVGDTRRELGALHVDDALDHARDLLTAFKRDMSTELRELENALRDRRREVRDLRDEAVDIRNNLQREVSHYRGLVEQLVRDAQRAAQPQTSSWSSMLAIRQQKLGCVGAIFQGAGVVTIIILVLALVGNLIHH